MEFQYICHPNRAKLRKGIIGKMRAEKETEIASGSGKREGETGLNFLTVHKTNKNKKKKNSKNEKKPLTQRQRVT